MDGSLAEGGAKHLAERKGKPDAMRSETTSRGCGVQSKGWGASAQAEGAVYQRPLRRLMSNQGFTQWKNTAGEDLR